MVLNANLNGTTGDDTLTYNNVSETALASSLLTGNDRLDAFLDSNGSVISGDEGFDTLDLFAPASLDRLADIESSTIRGGLGDDLIRFSSSPGSRYDEIKFSFINSNEGNDTVQIGFSNSVINSTVRGGDGNDSVSVFSAIIMQGMLSNGNDGNDTIIYEAPIIDASSIYGGLGDDTVIVIGETTNSIVSGDDGNDFVGDPAHDTTNSTLRGGNGDDTLSVRTIRGTSLVIGNIGNDSVSVFSSNGGKSSVRGGDGQDTIFVNENLSLVNGNEGNDSITVTDGSSATVIGTVRGGTGNDIITSGGGDRYAEVYGDTGADTLNDGAGNNHFIYNFGDTELIGVSGFDDIMGFDSNVGGTADRVQLASDDIVNNIAGLSGAITVTNAVVTAGVGSLSDFINAGASLTTAGAAIGVNSTTITTPLSFVFISDGDGKKSSGDLLIGFNATISSLTFFEGDIVSLV